MTTVTTIAHAPGYVPAGPASEQSRSAGAHGTVVEVTAITHEDGDPPPAGTASEYRRTSAVLPVVDANRQRIAVKLRESIADLTAAHTYYTNPLRTAVEKQNFVLDRFDDLLKVVTNLCHDALADYTSDGID